MDKVYDIIGLITGGHMIAGTGLIFLALILFIIQFAYWLRRYGKIPGYRNGTSKTSGPGDGISVIVLLCDDFYYLENILPKLMGQQYNDFEVVIVSVSSSAEFTDELEMMKSRFPNLASARIDPDPRFRVSDKMIYNIGIKTAKYDNIIMGTSETHPVSDKWLECMAKGFSGGEVIVAYCGLEHRKGILHRLIRCSRLMSSIRYLTAAIEGKPYRGIIGNLGFSKRLYLDSRGFNHLNMTIGEDDLFVQKIATGANTSIVMNPNATIRQELPDGLGGWWRQRRLHGSARQYYPRRVKLRMNTEITTRFILMVDIVTIAILLPSHTIIAAGGLWLLRWFVLHRQVKRICRRLGERGLSWTIMLYDIIEPFSSLLLILSRRFRPAKEVWK